MNACAYLEMVDKSGECDAWVDTTLAALLVPIDYVTSGLTLLFFGISLTTSDVLMFMLSTLLMSQEWLIRYPLAILIGQVGPQGSDCAIYAHQFPSQWGQLVGVLTAFGMRLALHRSTVPGRWTFFMATTLLAATLFAPLYRQINTATEIAISFWMGVAIGFVAFQCIQWFLSRYGDAFVALPVIKWFSFDNAMIIRSAPL